MDSPSSTFAAGDRGRPLQLIGIGSNNDLHLNHATLNELSRQIGNKAVSVFSIVGPTQGGKSFLFGYFLRYLEAMEFEDIDLMGWQNKTKPLDGFKFGIGNEPITKGIWVWSRPFTATSDDGEEVAVLLLDCQGITPDDKVEALFNLSVLISSHLIINCIEDIPEHVICNLRTCLKYGNNLKESAEEEDLSPFQNLTFLIRDWMDTEKYSHGEMGGKTFLKSKLKPRPNDTSETGRIWAMIKTSFEALSCFLMPTPGDNCKSPQFTGSISELSQPFAKKVEQFIGSVAGEGKIIPKKLLGTNMTGPNLKYAIEKYMELFSSEGSPNADAILEVSQEVVKNIVIQSAMQKYRQAFFQKKPKSAPYFCEEPFKKAHDFANKQALNVIREAPSFGLPGELKSDFQRQLKSTQNEIMKDNERTRRTYIAEQKESVINAFREDMEGNFAVFEDDFTLYEESYIQKEAKALKSRHIDEFSDKFSHESEETCGELIESLQEEFDHISHSIIEKNRKNQVESEQIMTNLMEKIFSEFNRKAEDFFRTNKFETDSHKIENALQTFKAEQEKSFQTKRKPGTRQFYGSYQQKLLDEIDRAAQNLRNNHEQQIQEEQSKLEDFINQKCADLRATLQNIFEEGGMNKSGIRLLYQTQAENITTKFNSINPFPKNSQTYFEMQEKMEGKLRSAINGILEVAENRKKEVDKTYQNAVAEAVQNFEQEIGPLRRYISSNFMTDDRLEEECRKVRQKTMYAYETVSKKESCAESDRKARQTLETQISNQIKNLKDHNKSQKSTAEDVAKNVVQNYITDYERHINHEVESCRSVRNLEIWHKEKVESIKKSLYEVGSDWDPKFTDSYANELEEKARKIFAQVQPKFQKKIEEHKMFMKSILVDGREYYHKEMGKHFENNEFIKPEELIDFHEKSKKTAISKCGNKKKLTPLQQDDLSRELDDLFPKYKNKNFMNVDSKEGSDLAPAVGIDLGTTYCCVGVYYKGKVHIIPNIDQGNEKTTPSYVAFDSDGSETIGKTAKDNAYKNPENTIYDAKRIIGRKMNDDVLQNDMKYWPFTVKAHNGVPKILVNGRYYHPEEVSSKLLKYFRAMAEKFLKLPEGTIKKAVITVPAYFNDGQRQATIDAGELAGLEVLTILNEPTAAAISYSMERLDSNAKNILVYDLGGGTFDVAILEMTTDGINVLGVNGDTHLGGEDFDQNVMKFCVTRFEEETEINLFEGKDSAVKTEKDECRRRLRRLQTYCENAKKDLTTARRVTVAVDGIIEGKDLSVVVTRAKFDELNMHHFKRTIQLIEETLNDVRLKKQDIDDIVLVGGSSRIPTVQTMLEEYFEGKALNKSIHPDHAVGYGAAIQAALMNGADAIGDFNLPQIADVTPMSIGVEIVTGELSVILERNSKIPTSKNKPYYTVAHNQRAINFKIYQGENLQIARQNKLLGYFTLNGIPPAPPGREPVDVTMSIDSMGVLHVEAVCRSTQSKNSITVVEDKQRMTKEEKEKILASDKPTPRPRFR